MPTQEHTYTNELINETSPYLLQHAHNPVDWLPWSEEAFEKAKKEDKPVIVSIGYSSCHWCHVMEHESFENPEIAQIMNEHFICIKVDREEHPDVDQIYMEALQSMGLGGGWPLNAFVLPDGQPFYGGTYFPANKWVYTIEQLGKAYKDRREEIFQSAEDATKSLNTSELLKYGLTDTSFTSSLGELKSIFEKAESRFDYDLGGIDREPKFPMPSVYKFLNRYYKITKEPKALEVVNATLTEMAKGGIYDQIGGGFSRYSVDGRWFAPHFEKMLYDNGQLMSLYSEGYLITKDPLYKEVVEETCDWLEREMTSEEGGFYSALDADSEGEEGKFYIWTYDELQKILPESDLQLFVDFYQVAPGGNWENDYNILHRNTSLEQFAKDRNINVDDFRKTVEGWKASLLEIRNDRIRPGLDDKILLSWNALMLKGLCDAYKAFGDKRYKSLALKNAAFIDRKFKNEDGLYHTYKNGQSTISAYLDDYAAYIEALIDLYNISFEEHYLYEAKRLADYVLANFYDEEEQMFFYTDGKSKQLIARKKELFDNVIPASNSIMATNMHFLSLYFSDANYQKISELMLGRMMKIVNTDVLYSSNWASLYTYKLSPTAEVAIVGKQLEAFRKEIEEQFYPNKILAGTKNKSDMELLKDREADQTTVYVCYNKTCKLPVTEVSLVFDQLRESTLK